MQNLKQPPVTEAIVFNIILHVTEASSYIQTMNPGRVLHPKARQIVISLRVLIDKAT